MKLSKKLINQEVQYSERLIPEDVWVQIALNNKAAAERIIDEIPIQHPFAIRYERQAIGIIDWESCTMVLSEKEKYKTLMDGWK